MTFSSSTDLRSTYSETMALSGSHLWPNSLIQATPLHHSSKSSTLSFSMFWVLRRPSDLLHPTLTLLLHTKHRFGCIVRMKCFLLVMTVDRWEWVISIITTKYPKSTWKKLPLLYKKFLIKRMKLELLMLPLPRSVIYYHLQWNRSNTQDVSSNEA